MVSTSPQTLAILSILTFNMLASGTHALPVFNNDVLDATTRTLASIFPFKSPRQAQAVRDLVFGREEDDNWERSIVIDFDEELGARGYDADDAVLEARVPGADVQPVRFAHIRFGLAAARLGDKESGSNANANGQRNLQGLWDEVEARDMEMWLEADELD